jgi:hypothetical protein
LIVVGGFDDTLERMRFEEGHATVDMTAVRSLINGAGSAVMAS